jgi:membrane protease YdiL (CAAX protease family)
MDVRPWSVLDFILVWLGGLVGSALLLGAAELIGDPDWRVVLSLAGQYAGSLVVFLLLTRRRDLGALGLEVEPRDFLYVGLGLVLQIALAIAFLPLSNLLFPDGRPQQEVADIIASADTLAVQVALVVAAVLLGPVTEEVMYRGILLKALETRGRVFAMIVTAAVFALVHVPGLSTERLLAAAALYLPPLFILGLVLARLTQRTGRLGPAILLHSGWNLLSALVLLLPSDILEQVS